MFSSFLRYLRLELPYLEARKQKEDRKSEKISVKPVFVTFRDEL